MLKPYEKVTTIELWTDPYISKQMLAAHLNPDIDAASRKQETIEKTVSFIETFLPKNKSICDFGCGPGLYTNLLQKRGYQVQGIDISTNSIEYAKTQNEEVEYTMCNYIEQPLKNKVDFIQMIYCDFGAMTPLSQKIVLENVYHSLIDDGVFFFDVMSMNYYNNTKEKTYYGNETDGFFTLGNVDIAEDVIKYEDLSLTLTHIKIRGAKDMDFYNYDKCYTKEVITQLVEQNGFKVLDICSDTMGNKFFEDSETLAIICQKK